MFAKTKKEALVDGFDVTDVTGARLGRVTEIWAGAGTTDPKWGRVMMDEQDPVERAVPLSGASWAGDHVVLGYRREQVVQAPEASVTAMSYEALCQHYGIAADHAVPQPAPEGPPDNWP